MSRNSKGAKRVAARKAMTQQRQSGQKGPSDGKRASTPKHTKKKAWWQVAPFSYKLWVLGSKKQKPIGAWTARMWPIKPTIKAKFKTA